MRTPKSRSRKKAPVLPGMTEVDRPTVVWFAKDGCIVREDDRRTVVVGTRRVGSWEPGERRIRNALMVQLASDPTIIFEDLAKAFEVSSETLRLQRRLYEAKGLSGVLAQPEPHHKGGRAIEPALRRKMERLFAQGASVGEATAALAGQAKYGTVEKYRRLWREKQAKRPRAMEQGALPLGSPTTEASTVPPAAEAAAASPLVHIGEASQEAPVGREGSDKEDAPHGEQPPIRVPRFESERVSRAALEPASPEREGVRIQIGEFAPYSENGVQHIGAWLLLVTIAGLGLYAHLKKHERKKAEGRPLRVAVDAVLTGLAIGGRCVESVRRLATKSAAAMLLAQSAPSATWVRRTLGGYTADKEVSLRLLEDVSGELLRRVRGRTLSGEPVILFIDNHGRQYTGRHLLRRIWRMQEKRAVPGALDYWVHDVEGRPLLVIPARNNASLPETIRSKVAFLREHLGPTTPLLLVFDRAGAFPGLWEWLRDNGVEFVTYQRASYRKFSREWFERYGTRMTLREANGEKIQVIAQTGRMNLGANRGRVRRIRLLMPGDVQLNVVAWSSQPDQSLCQTLFRRWRQENGLKHGVERWGLNQLDGRQVEDVPSGTLVTNPNYANLSHLLRDDRQREQELRLQLQQMYPGHPQRPALKRALADNRAAQREVVEARRRIPKKIPVEQTGLHGELKQHTREYKLLLDTLRCTAQYAEAELAATLAASLPRSREAKRLLQNVFSAPGDVRVTTKAITVRLAPSANRSEQEALKEFFHAVNQRQFRHPGDPFARPVRFKLQTA